MLTPISGFSSNKYQTKFLPHFCSLERLPSFGYRLPNRTFSDTRDIPKLTCACCGNVMLTKEDLKELSNSFLPGSSKALKSSLLDDYKDTRGYEFLLKHSKAHPKTPIKKLIELPEVQKELKSLKTKTQIQVTDISHISSTMSVSSIKVIKKLDNFRDMFKKDYTEILNIMELYALKYPDKTFSEIFKIPEIKEYNEHILDLQQKKSIIQRINVFKSLNKIGTALKDRDLKLFRETNSKAVEILNKDYYKDTARKILVEDLYEQFEKSCTDKKTAALIKKTAKDFPTDKNTPELFILNCTKEAKSDALIINIILEELRATFEHIMLKSEDGKYVDENGIILCKSCNNERGNMPYKLFLKLHPEMLKNVQKQIDKVIVFIKHGKLPDSGDYLPKLKKNLFDETDKQIKLNIKKYFKNKELASKAELDKAKALAEENQKNYEIAHTQYMEAQKRLKEAMETVNRIKKESGLYQTQANDAHNKKAAFDKTVQDAQINLRKIEQQRKADEKV